ncbi:gypsy type transposase [Tanacetum coccineum]
MASLYLESDTGEDAPQWIRDLRPSFSQLKIPVYPEVRDPKYPWVVKEEMLLEDAIAANKSRAEKKRKCRIICLYTARKFGVSHPLCQSSENTDSLCPHPPLFQGSSNPAEGCAAQTEPPEASSTLPPDLYVTAPRHLLYYAPNRSVGLEVAFSPRFGIVPIVSTNRVRSDVAHCSEFRRGQGKFPLIQFLFLRSRRAYEFLHPTPVCPPLQVIDCGVSPEGEGNRVYINSPFIERPHGPELGLAAVKGFLARDMYLTIEVCSVRESDTASREPPSNNVVACGLAFIAEFCLPPFYHQEESHLSGILLSRSSMLFLLLPIPWLLPPRVWIYL